MIAEIMESGVFVHAVGIHQLETLTSFRARIASIILMGSVMWVRASLMASLAISSSLSKRMEDRLK